MSFIEGTSGGGWVAPKPSPAAGGGYTQVAAPAAKTSSSTGYTQTSPTYTGSVSGAIANTPRPPTPPAGVVGNQSLFPDFGYGNTNLSTGVGGFGGAWVDDPNQSWGGPPQGGGGGGSEQGGAWQQQLAQQQLGLSQLDSAEKAARERAIINYGDPAMADLAGFGLDPQAGAFARQNYLSGNATKARMEKTHDLARKAIIDKLASHGLLDSGDFGYQQGQEDQNYGNQTYDAKQRLLGYLADLHQSSLDRRQSLRNSLLGAYQNAYSGMLGNY